ncbi:Hydrolase [Sulfitobacter noctilucicola]|uniref:2-haloacid dehalogenase n=1 Tax=Sulfitobacter noctilucicola TaxID=1342301 RepID=A0A7W6M4Q8_9RHOB|nr:HAD family phosphatase [Sulfitobacter noctilucicola]KIN63079.1 Hydrolase [Sulfitobacter noctilucicola]MBB4172394.1 2-haloacid dehalogenase [Sulfitobacter noctilucicola]
MTPQAVVFDIGNVLIEWQPERFFDGVIGEGRRRAMFDAVDLHAMNDRVDSGETFQDVITEVAEATPDWHREIMLWHDRWLDMASPAIDHSVRLMGALQARGVPVFSLTNFGIQTYDLAATRYPFLRQFDRDFISGHLGVIKPNPAIYQAVEEAGGIAPQALLFTDDRTDNIAAAAARGWQTHLFEGSQGWADRLVAAGLLSAEDAK